MKKLLVMVLAGIMSVSMLAGCGKSDEEKAADEIAQHLRDEAAEDGVDLDAEIAKEQAEYEANSIAKQEENASKEEILAEMNSDAEELSKVAKKYFSAASSSEVISAAEEYNDMYEAYMEKALDYGWTEGSVRTVLVNRGAITNTIPENFYKGKALYMDKCMNLDYDEMTFAYNEEGTDFFFILEKQDGNGVVNDIQIMKADGAVYSPDLSSVTTSMTIAVSVDSINDKEMIVGTIDNADWLAFRFEITGTSSSGTKTSDREVSNAYNQEHFWNSLDEFNNMEKRQLRY